MQTNNTSTKQEALNYIESLELTPGEMKILKALNILIQLYTENNKKQMDKRFADLEVSLRQYFEQMIGDHRNSMDDVLNKYMGEWYRKNMVARELHESMRNLTERIKCMKWQ